MAATGTDKKGRVYMRVKYFCTRMEGELEVEYVVNELCSTLQGGMSRLSNIHSKKHVKLVSFYGIVYGTEKGRTVAQRAHLRTMEMHIGNEPGDKDWYASNIRRK